MTKILIVVLTLISANAFAKLPQSAVSSAKFKMYAMYSTTDPTCMTGLVAIQAFTATPVNIDLINNTKIGNGKVAGDTKCLVAVLDNTGGPWTVAAGTYSTTSTGGSDSVCSGATIAATKVCNAATDTLTWPDKIKTDAAAAGVTLPTACSTTGGVPIPIFRSSYSICAGSSSDPSACTGATVKAFLPPTAADSTSNGIKLGTATDGGKKYRVWNGYTDVFGNSGGSCGFVGIPTTGIAKVE